MAKKHLQNHGSQSHIRTITASKSSVHIGPLPHPDLLAKYNEIIPDGANRIMTMAEKQQDHRSALENLAVRAQLQQSAKGQIFGFIISIIGLAISVSCILTGHELGGSILGGGGLLGLVSVFVYGKQRQSKSLKEKNNEN